jgi:hypothetical protein
LTTKLLLLLDGPRRRALRAWSRPEPAIYRIRDASPRLPLQPATFHLLYLSALREDRSLWLDGGETRCFIVCATVHTTDATPFDMRANPREDESRKSVLSGPRPSNLRFSRGWTSRALCDSQRVAASRASPRDPRRETSGTTSRQIDTTPSVVFARHLVAFLSSRRRTSDRGEINALCSSSSRALHRSR